MAQIIIVSGEDQVIGYKERSEITEADIYRVAALWLQNEQNEVLLAQRAFTKEHDPGKWGPAVAGTLEKGETYLTNIIKEAEEELGLKQLKLITLEKTFRQSGNKNFFVQWYFANVIKNKTQITMQKSEVQDIQWIKYQDLLNSFNAEPQKYLRSVGTMAIRFSPK